MLLKRDPTDALPAEGALQSAIAVAKRQGARSFGLRAALSLAELYQSTARPTEAHALLAPTRSDIYICGRMCEPAGMAQTVCVLPPAEDREHLLAIVADRNRPLKHVRRAHIVLCSGDRLPVQEVARRAGVSRPAVWRWQARYSEQGVDSLLRDKTRKPGRAPLSAKVVAKVLDLTCSEPPGQATHWTGRAMAKAVGVSLRAVQRLWEAHRLQPHRIRTFKRSNDPEFAEKVEDIVGLYMDPPKHAVVVSIDEKSQIQALDRTQPGLPLKPGKCGTMTHDYKRNGTTTLFAALNILDGTVIGRCINGIATRNSFASSTPSSAPSRPEKSSMPSLTTTPPTNSPTSSNGWPIIRAGRSISRRPRPRGSTPSRASSPPFRAAEYAAEPSHPSETCKMRSTATSTPTTPIVGRSYGQRPPKPSSKNSLRSVYLLS